METLMDKRPCTLSPPHASTSTKDETTSLAKKFSIEEHIYHKHITLGIEEKLQKNRMIKDIVLSIQKPTEKSTISGWERKHGVSLPQDLKDFYLSTNGFKLTWSLEHAGDNLKIGEMNINSINQFLPLESIGQFDKNEDNGGVQANSNRLFELKHLGGKIDISKLQLLPGRKMSDEGNEQNFGIQFKELRQTMEANGQLNSSERPDLFLLPNDKAFILDQNKYGWVALIYPEVQNHSMSNHQSSPRSISMQDHPQVLSPEPHVEIWYLDKSLQWHFLSATFSHYYRMLIFHLGLPLWQCRFTPYGLSSWAEQMFWLVAPHLLTQPKILKSNNCSKGLWSSDVPDDVATPNPLPNVLSSQLFRRKKKTKVDITSNE